MMPCWGLLKGVAPYSSRKGLSSFDFGNQGLSSTKKHGNQGDWQSPPMENQVSGPRQPAENSTAKDVSLGEPRG